MWFRLTMEIVLHYWNSVIALIVPSIAICTSLILLNVEQNIVSSTFEPLFTAEPISYTYLAIYSFCLCKLAQYDDDPSLFLYQLHFDFSLFLQYYKVIVQSKDETPHVHFHSDFIQYEQNGKIAGVCEQRVYYPKWKRHVWFRRSSCYIFHVTRMIWIGDRLQTS